MRRLLAETGLRRWFYFSVLAEELNFTRAADRLHIAQPSLSQQIRALERDLGVALLERSGPRFRLTAAGEAARTEADDLLERYERAVSRITAAGQGLSGELHLAYSHSAAADQGAGLVGAYRERYPDVRVSAEAGWTGRNVAGLRQGTLDLAFVRPPVDEPEVTVCPVGAEEILLALPREHPLARTRRRLRRDQIAGEPVILWPREHAEGYYDSVIRQFWPSGPPPVVREEPDDQQLLRAVAAGEGVAPVPEHRARELRSPGVVFRHLASPQPTVQLGLAYRTRDTNPVVLNFVALLRTG